MLLGKRPRPHIRRTTSMTGITVDLPNMDTTEPSSDHQSHQMIGDPPHAPLDGVVLEQSSSPNYNHYNMMNNHSLLYGGDGGDHRFLATMVSPRNVVNHGRSSADFLETAHFLTTCGLCNRRLAPGRDIYMYRGDTAFCSLECREKQMKHDERKEKCSSSVNVEREDHHRHASSSSSSSSKAAASSSSRKSETVAAA